MDTVCPEADPDFQGDTALRRAEFAVQFSKPTDATARGAIFEVAYRSGGSDYVHRIGFELILRETDESVPECEFRDPEDYGWD